MVYLGDVSGSGKSTLLRCMNLLEKIDDGLILLDAQDISARERDPAPIRQRIGIVFRSFNLFAHMTALEHVRLAPRRVKGLSRAELLPTVEALFAAFGLADRMHHGPDQLSGGQQHRVAILRALAMEPEIMLGDEITAALGPDPVGAVLDVLRKLRAEGVTTVRAAHEMAFAREGADRMCFLSEGRILELAPPGALFAAPTTTASGRSRAASLADRSSPGPNTPRQRHRPQGGSRRAGKNRFASVCSARYPAANGQRRRP